MSLLPCQYDCPVAVRCRVAALKQQNLEAFYLNESDVSTGDFGDVPQDQQNTFY
jgi:hypothetical protein